MADKFLKLVAGQITVADADHGNLAGLVDDDHAQYLLLAGRPGNQTVYGAGQVLTLLSGDDGDFSSLGIGRAGLEGYFGVCNGPNSFFTGTAGGDLVFRIEDNARSIHIGPDISGYANLQVAPTHVRALPFLAVGHYSGVGLPEGDLVLRRSATTGALFFGDSNAKYLYFDGDDFMLIGHTNFGVGTPDPKTKLHVDGWLTLNAAAGFPAILHNLYYDGGAGVWRYIGDGYGTLFSPGFNGEYRFYSSPLNASGADAEASSLAIRMTIANSGNVTLEQSLPVKGYLGVGTVSPDYRLHLVGTTDQHSRIAIEATGEDSNAYLSTKNDARTFLFGIAGWDSDSFIIFDETAWVTRMRISSFGVVNFGNFQVGSDGDIEKIKNVSLDWPSTNATGFLKNNGSGSLSWDNPADLAGEGHILLAFYNYNAQDTGTWNPQVYTSSYLNGNIYNSSHNDGDEISWKAFLAAGTYTLRVCYHKDSHSGIVDVYIDSTEVGSVDTYAASFSGNNLYTATGISIGTSGLKTIKAKVDGKNVSSDNHYAQIVSIALWRTA